MRLIVVPGGMNIKAGAGEAAVLGSSTATVAGVAGRQRTLGVRRRWGGQVGPCNGDMSVESVGAPDLSLECLGTMTARVAVISSIHPTQGYGGS